MLGSNIYAEPDVAVREMIQNAHDTCIIRKTKDRGFRDPEIQITYNKAQQTLTFSDNGAGMTEEELHKYLSTIGEGFTKIQKDALKGAGAQEALLLIGQFGIGLLSAFSVAEQVEVFTRSYLPKSSGFKWVCAGDIHYTVEPVDKPDAGTRVVLHVTDKNLVLLDDKRLQQAIKKYADFLSVPIYLKGNQINSCTPPWLKESSPEEYETYLHTRYDLHPLVSFPFHIEKPLHLDGLLFVPLPPSGLTRDFGELDIYIARMFIKANDKELLPHWARFIKGVINTPDLIPTVSRDELVRDEQYARIRNLLGEIILEYLAALEQQSPETLDLIVGTYNSAIKAHSLEDDAFFERICDLVRVSTDAGNLSMHAYLQKSNGVIYYFSERGTATQHKLLFAQKGLPVIDASWGLEEEFLEKYAARQKVKLERLEAGSEMIFKPVTTDDVKWQDLERQFQICLHKEAKAVAFEPNTVPAVLVAKPMERDEKNVGISTGLGLNSAQIRQLFERTRRASESGDDTILHLNTTNSLMQQLRDMNRNETFRLALSAILSNATLFAQHYVTPENAETIFSTNNDVISMLIRNTLALTQLQGEHTRIQIEFDELKRKMQRFGEFQISVELRRKIVGFLTDLPNMDTLRQTLIYQAGLDEQLQKQIVMDGQSVKFVQMLVETLIKYGRLSDGRHALKAVLQAAQAFVGIDKRVYCETLIQELQQF